MRLIGVAMALAATVAWADTVTVKPEAYVKGPEVYLGDIADISGDHADALARVQIVQAALPGDSKQFNASLVEARIRNTGAFNGDLTIAGADQVVARTLAQEMTPDTLVSDLHQYITAEMPWDVADASITVDAPTQPLVIPEGDVAVQWSTSPVYRWLGTSAFRGDVLVDGVSKGTVNLRATIEAFTEVMVAKNEIARGTLISAAHVTREKRAVSQLKSGSFTEPEEVIGQISRSTIFPGTVLTTRQVQPRRLIKRNQLIYVETRAGGLSVRSRARALGDGYEGDMIQLAHPETKAEFFGVVQADGSVRVE